MKGRPLLSVVLPVLTAMALLATRVAVAAPTVITTRPEIDPTSGDAVLFVGGIDDNGRSIKASAIEVSVGGKPVVGPTTAQAMSDWAAVASEHSASWRPPIVSGVTYLWIEGVPSGVLDGIHAFFQRVPSRTPVFPTVYGRMRQGRARLSAADISRLDEVPHLEAYKPNLLDAVRLDMADVAVATAPIKILLIITDGRDFADPKGQGPGDFAALGREIRKAGITPIIVGFPAPEADAQQSAANLRDLHDAAGGFLKLLDQADDLENTLESLGQAVADLQHVQVPIPWDWHTFGGSRRMAVKITTGEGKRYNADVGSLEVKGGSGTWIIAGGAIVVGLLLILIIVLVARAARNRGGSEEEDDRDAVVTAAHDLIRRGASPQRAVDELTRMFAETVHDLVELDPEVMTDERYPYFRTRPGRQRMKEIRELLANKTSSAPGLGAMVAEVLAGAVTEGTPPEQAAEAMSARAAPDEWTAFAGMELDQLADALLSVKRAHPALGSPRARGIAVAIQDALRMRASSARGISIAWLVRSSGPGKRGETLRIEGERTVLGSGPSAGIRLSGDPTVAAEHAEVLADGGDFAVNPLAGAVSVEGKAIDRRLALSDGDTIQIGAGRFVFKSVTVGNLQSRAAGPPPARGRGRAASSR